MSFPSTSSAFSNFSTSSISSSFSRNHHHHQVSFGSVPGSQPGVLSWGIGMSSANRNGNGWSSQTSTPPPPPPNNIQWGSQSQSQSPVTSSSRRRRRSDTPESDQDELELDQPRERIIKPISTTATTTTTKRVRRIVNNSSEVGSLSLASTSLNSNVQDLGKSLASLDKPALLGIFSSLLESHPHLSPTISSLLPTPTLSSTLERITLETRQLQSQIPTGNSSPSYILSRMRLPLESFVQEMKTLLSIYVPPSLPSPSSSSSCSSDELYHPTTTMSFLLHLSASYLSISQSLPSSSSSSSSSSSNHRTPLTPLESHLLPNLINSFHVFITRLSNQVNQQGKILSIFTVKNWFQELDSLTTSNSTTREGEIVINGKRALEGVRDRLKKEIGWLVGIKSTTNTVGMESSSSNNRGNSMMEEEEEL